MRPRVAGQLVAVAAARKGPVARRQHTLAPVAAAAQPPKSDWAKLDGQLTGRLSLPGSPGYPVDRELYDPLFDSVHPAAIAFCANATDVARSITFARDHGLAIAARSGGHSYAGYSTTTGLVIDVSLMSR